MKLFDVSFYTFLTATSYLVGPGIDRKIGEGAGMIVIGYRENTTSVPTDKIGRDDLREKFSTLLDTPTNKFAFRKITNHKDAVPALLGDRDREAIDLYIGDRPILASLREWEIAATLRKKEAVRSELRAVDKNLSAAKQSLEQAQSAKKDVEEAESEVEAASAEVSAIEDKLNALTERERILKEGLIVSTDVLNIQPYALILPKCSRHLFRLNQFLAAKFRDPAFIEKWKGRFGYDFDVAMEKIIEFQTSIPVGSVIQVDEPTCKQPG